MRSPYIRGFPSPGFIQCESFPDQDATLNLAEKGRNTLKDLTDRYSSASSRSLKRVNIPRFHGSLLSVAGRCRCDVAYV